MLFLVLVEQHNSKRWQKGLWSLTDCKIEKRWTRSLHFKYLTSCCAVVHKLTPTKKQRTVTNWIVLQVMKWEKLTNWMELQVMKWEKLTNWIVLQLMKWDKETKTCRESLRACCTLRKERFRFSETFQMSQCWRPEKLHHEEFWFFFIYNKCQSLQDSQERT